MRFDNEDELERILMSYHENSGFCFVTNEEVGHLYQQVNIGPYGIIDMLGVTIETEPYMVSVNIIIYELKLNSIKAKDVVQISRYYKGVSEYLWNAYSIGREVINSELCARTFNRKCGKRCRVEVNLKGILVGKQYDMTSDVCFLVDSIPWLSCYHYSLGAEGIDFELDENWRSGKGLFGKETTDCQKVLELKDFFLKQCVGYRGIIRCLRKMGARK